MMKPNRYVCNVLRKTHNYFYEGDQFKYSFIQMKITATFTWYAPEYKPFQVKPNGCYGRNTSRKYLK